MKMNFMASENYVSEIVKVAHKEKGYKEKKTNAYLEYKEKNAGRNNYTKYGKWIGANGDYWCASYLSWLFNEAFGKDNGKELLCGAFSPACETIRTNFKNKGQYITNSPKSGDVIFFKGTRHAGANHIGLVTKVENGRVYTSEGNADDSDTDNGGAVVEKSYPLNYARILGYGRPKYDKKPKTTIGIKCRLYKKNNVVSGAYGVLDVDHNISFIKDMGYGWSQVKAAIGASTYTGYVKNTCIKGKSRLSKYRTGIIIKDNTPLRQKNKKLSKCLKKIKSGSRVEVVSIGKSWTAVKYDGVNGFVYNSKIEVK